MLLRCNRNIVNLVVKYLIVCSYLLINVFTQAQVPNIRFHQISLEEGLSHSLVSDMVEDDLGFIWFGTQDGLNRYDGYDRISYSLVLVSRLFLLFYHFLQPTLNLKRKRKKG